MTLLVRAAVTARMRQLQSDQQPVIGSRNLAVFFNECRLELRQTCPCVRSRQKLVRICAPLLTNGNRFASPDQFRPAAPESLPAAQRMFAGVPVACSVPPFHGLHGEAIANLDAFANNWLRQRRLCSAKEFGVAWDC